MQLRIGTNKQLPATDWGSWTEQVASQSSATQSPSAIFMPDSSAEVLHISSVHPRMMSLDSGVSLNSALVCTHDAAPLPLLPPATLDGSRSSTMGWGAAQQCVSPLAP